MIGLDFSVVVALLSATIRVATPLIYGAMGELLCERAGVLNLGIEGTMVLGAMAGFWVGYASGWAWAGVAAAAGVGLLSGLLMALLAVRLGLNQHVSGLGVTLLSGSLALFFYRVAFGNRRVPPRIDPLPRLEAPDFLGPLAPLFNQYPLTYAAFLLVPVLWWFLYRSSFGLHVRAAGENPEAVDVAGVDVFRVRTAALAAGGMLMGLGGAFLSLAQLGAFTPGIVSGRGWVAVALVIFGNWQPFRVLGGALAFGAFDALQLHLQTVGLRLPYQALLALPYLATVALLALARSGSASPAALLRPYRREA